jgi:hypothetical protein
MQCRQRCCQEFLCTEFVRRIRTPSEIQSILHLIIKWHFYLPDLIAKCQRENQLSSWEHEISELVARLVSWSLVA